MISKEAKRILYVAFFVLLGIASIPIGLHSIGLETPSYLAAWWVIIFDVAALTTLLVISAELMFTISKEGTS